MKMREIIEKEQKMKHHLLESPSHQKVRHHPVALQASLLSVCCLCHLFYCTFYELEVK